MKLENAEFQELCRLIKTLCGMEIKDEKHYLVSQRLEHLAMSEGGGSFRGLIDKLAPGTDHHLRDKVIEAITTHETSFFRDGHPFETFRDVILPELGEMVRHRKAAQQHRKGAQVNIWSVASSTGQEAYSISMLVHEYVRSPAGAGLNLEDFEIIATDISPHVLAKAVSGSYNELEVAKGLSPERRDKYFRKEGKHWVVDDALRSMVDFRRVNLAEPFTRIGGVDVIFCRNVLIYFSEEIRNRIFEQFRQILSETGYMILGACENMVSAAAHFKTVNHKETILYVRSGK